MKPHTRVAITREYLESLSACNAALLAFDPLLPAWLSTDPEQNIDIALAVAEVLVEVLVVLSQCPCCNWINWLAESVGAADNSVDEARWLDSSFVNYGIVLVTMQQLAWIADKIAAEEGR